MQKGHYSVNVADILRAHCCASQMLLLCSCSVKKRYVGPISATLTNHIVLPGNNLYAYSCRRMTSLYSPERNYLHSLLCRIRWKRPKRWSLSTTKFFSIYCFEICANKANFTMKLGQKVKLLSKFRKYCEPYTAMLVVRSHKGIRACSWNEPSFWDTANHEIEMLLSHEGKLRPSSF